MIHTNVVSVKVCPVFYNIVIQLYSIGIHLRWKCPIEIIQQSFVFLIVAFVNGKLYGYRYRCTRHEIFYSFYNNIKRTGP